MFANVGPDPPDNQRVNAVWTLGRRSWSVNGAIGEDVGVDFGCYRDIVGSDTDYRSVAGSDIGCRGDDESSVSRRDIADSLRYFADSNVVARCRGSVGKARTDVPPLPTISKDSSLESLRESSLKGR